MQYKQTQYQKCFAFCIVGAYERRQDAEDDAIRAALPEVEAEISKYGAPAQRTTAQHQALTARMRECKLRKQYKTTVEYSDDTIRASVETVMADGSLTAKHRVIATAPRAGDGRLSRSSGRLQLVKMHAFKGGRGLCKYPSSSMIRMAYSRTAPLISWRNRFFKI